MEYAENLYQSLNRYQTALSNVGYYDRRQQRGVLIYLFIVNEVFSGILEDCLDDDGLAALENAIRCLQGAGCLISNLRHIRYSKPLPNTSASDTRSAIPEKLRSVSIEELRIIEEGTELGK